MPTILREAAWKMTVFHIVATEGFGALLGPGPSAIASARWTCPAAVGATMKV